MYHTTTATLFCAQIKCHDFGSFAILFIYIFGILLLFYRAPLMAQKEKKYVY